MKLKAFTTAPILAIFVYLLTLCAERIIAGLDMNVNAYLLTSGIIQVVTYLLPLALYGLIFGNLRPARMRLTAPSAVSVPTQILLAVILFIGTSLISMLSIRLGFSAPQDGIASGIGAPSALVLLIFAVIPAVCEEILFRGVIMSSFEPCGVATAITATSVLFAAAHMSLEDFPVYFFASLILCFAVYVSRSVVASIIIHSLYNISALAFGDYINGIAAHLESFSLLFIALLFSLWILAAIALTEASRVYRSYAEKGLSSAYTPQKLTGAQMLKGAAAVYFSLPFLLAVVIFIAVVVFSMQNIS